MSALPLPDKRCLNLRRNPVSKTSLLAGGLPMRIPVKFKQHLLPASVSPAKRVVQSRSAVAASVSLTVTNKRKR